MDGMGWKSLYALILRALLGANKQGLKIIIQECYIQKLPF